MMTKALGLCGLAAVLGALALWSIDNEGGNASGAATGTAPRQSPGAVRPARAEGHAPGAAGHPKGAREGTNPWVFSPFGAGPPREATAEELADAEDRTMEPALAKPFAPRQAADLAADAEAAQRRITLGYEPPPEMLKQGPQALQALAQGGNAHAKAMVAEALINGTSPILAAPPALSAQAQAQATELLQDALALGHVRSASLIAELAMRQHNPTEAYAWHLVAERLGDTFSSRGFRNSEWYLEADDAQRLAAQAKLPALLADIEARKSAAATR